LTEPILICFSEWSPSALRHFPCISRDFRQIYVIKLPDICQNILMGCCRAFNETSRETHPEKGLSRPDAFMQNVFPSLVPAVYASVKNPKAGDKKSPPSWEIQGLRGFFPSENKRQRGLGRLHSIFMGNGFESKESGHFASGAAYSL